MLSRLGGIKNMTIELTLALQKSRMLQIQGIEGEVTPWRDFASSTDLIYREPLSGLRKASARQITRVEPVKSRRRRDEKHGKFNGFLQFTFG